MHRVPDVRVEVHHGAARIDGGVVDQDVDLAAELDGRLHHALGVLELGDVARAGDGRARREQGDGLVQLVLPAPGDADLRPLGHEPLGDLHADAGARPGDHGHFAFEHHVQLLLF